MIVVMIMVLGGCGSKDHVSYLRAEKTVAVVQAQNICTGLMRKGKGRRERKPPQSFFRLFPNLVGNKGSMFRHNMTIDSRGRDNNSRLTFFYIHKIKKMCWNEEVSESIDKIDDGGGKKLGRRTNKQTNTHTQ